MNKREFNAMLRRVSSKKRLDPKLCDALDSATKADAVKLIVRNRHPIATCLMPETKKGAEFDAWLNSCGYMYFTTSASTGLAFRHTSEHQID